MKAPKPTTIDFETFGIEGRPKYPPVPVGVSIKKPGKRARYYAWGHLQGNNCTFVEAVEALRDAWSDEHILFQNGKFDVDVGEIHCGLPRRAWDAYHDTLYLLYLDDPHQAQLGLKPSAERLLGMAPDEQDEVADWLILNQPVPGVKITRGRGGPHYFGKYIAYAPGDLVGKYANGDTERTAKIFDHLYAKTVKRGMLEAYNRERKLMPILLEVERQGIRIDHKKLAADVKFYNDWRDKLSAWIVKTIKAPADINLNSGDQLVNAMIAAGKVDVESLGVTATGKYKTDKESLMHAVTDKQLLAVLKYLTQLNTCLNTFMQPWLAVADQSGGLIYTTWNQTKSTESGGAVGTRTGRLSSTPNFQNIPKTFTAIFAHEVADPKAAKLLPKCPFKDLPALPEIRCYIVPYKKDHVLIDRDYSQQELRILGHFEGGALLDAYIENPWLDVHDYARDMINGMLGRNYDRKPIKNTGFGLIYGMGIGKLAWKSDITVELAKEVKDAYLTIFPGLKEMYKDMKYRAGNKLPIRTWGGREYYCEEPRLIDGRIRTFDYKMLNVLVQGSAADCTKEAIIRWWELRDPEDLLYLNVHDQITLSVPKRRIKDSMEKLKTGMEGIEFDVPMYSEGSWSDKNWGVLVDYDKKGKLLYGARK